jgi:hypothetical protein
MSLRGTDGRKASDRLQPGDQDHQVDDDREDRPPDEEIRELHEGVGGPCSCLPASAAGLFAGMVVLLTCTERPDGA